MKSLLVMLSVALATAVHAENLPVPPIPPVTPVPDATAPIPDPDVRVPVAEVSEAPRVDVRLYRSTPYDPGVAFAPGSRYRSNEDRKPIQTPGLSISVPLK
jgi:hypothetical protein